MLRSLFTYWWLKLGAGNVPIPPKVDPIFISLMRTRHIQIERLHETSIVRTRYWSIKRKRCPQ